MRLVVVGNGSNLLVQDGEHDVVAIRLAGDFVSLEWRDEGEAVVVNAGAGHDLPVAARRLAGAGVIGFEWAVGVPGTFGGALAMNAGGHGDDIASSIEHATVWRDAVTTTWSRERLALSYRSSALQCGDVVLGVTLRLRRGSKERAEAELRKVVKWRREHQPGGANAGSVFRNPRGDYAARLIEAAKCKGLRVGSAMVSEKHANFIQVDSGGSADDVYELMQLVARRVLEHSGVTLVSEHRFIGFEEEI
jgi:UDP-N-acetylmuramate dehydrogenase